MPLQKKAKKLIRQALKKLEPLLVDYEATFPKNTEAKRIYVDGLIIPTDTPRRLLQLVEKCIDKKNNIDDIAEVKNAISVAEYIYFDVALTKGNKYLALFCQNCWYLIYATNSYLLGDLAYAIKILEGLQFFDIKK